MKETIKTKIQEEICLCAHSLNMQQFHEYFKMLFYLIHGFIEKIFFLYLIFYIII